jgi:hypothetical protein
MNSTIPDYPILPNGRMIPESMAGATTNGSIIWQEVKKMFG